MAFISLIHTFFSIYSMMLMIKIISSWFSELSQFSIIQLNHRLTEPYLSFFRRVIPPIGGVLDITPIIAFFILRVIEGTIIRIIVS
ncbi:MAG: YggT family protein [Chlamydia sp.]